MTDNFFEKFHPESALTAAVPIASLMKDLADALHVNPNILFLGGGNPAHIPPFEAVMAQHLKQITASNQSLHHLLGVYQPPAGDEQCRENVARYLSQKWCWPITAKNIFLAQGGQSAFFMLLNIFTHRPQKPQAKKIVFPLMPDYLGYADQAAEGTVFEGFMPKINVLPSGRFKYGVDFEHLKVDDGVGALCLSRPTNPSGNVVTDEELERLAGMAGAAEIPLLLDCAYGYPFPGLNYTSSTLPWYDHGVYVMSLSKLGLPGLRTAAVVGSEALVDALARMNAVTNLATNNLGPMLLSELIESDSLDAIVQETVKPFYVQQREAVLAMMSTIFDGVPYKLHEPEGAFFLWLWFDELNISSQELYEYLKAREVLILPGEHFFFALNDVSSPHTRQCVRLNYCQPLDVIQRALEVIRETVKKFSVSHKSYS